MFCWHQNEEDREYPDVAEYLPHYIVYNADMRILYTQFQNLVLEPEDTQSSDGVHAFCDKLLRDTGIVVLPELVGFASYSLGGCDNGLTLVSVEWTTLMSGTKCGV